MSDFAEQYHNLDRQLRRERHLLRRISIAQLMSLIKEGASSKAIERHIAAMAELFAAKQLSTCQRPEGER